MLRFFAFLLLCVSMVQAAVIHVPGDQPTLDEAIQFAALNDTVALANQVHQINPSSTILIAASIVIASEGALSPGGSDNYSACQLAGNESQIRFEGDSTLFGTLMGIDLYSCSVAANDTIGCISIQDCNFVESDLFLSRLLQVRCQRIAMEDSQVNFQYIDDLFVDQCTTNNAPELALYIQWSNAVINGLVVSNCGTSYPSGRTAPIIIRGSIATFSGATVTANRVSREDHPILRLDHSSVVDLHNLIMYDNDYTISGMLIELHASSQFATNVLNIDYSCIENGTNDVIVGNIYSDLSWGDGVITNDPMLTTEYHLSSSSPCIDAGDPNSPLDPDGTIADMGAYYYCQGDQVTIPEEIVAVTEPGYPIQLEVQFTSSCDGVAIDSANTTLAEFILGAYPDSVGAEYQTGIFNLTFNPQTQGLFQDTLHIWADTEISNTDDPRHHVVPLIGESGPIPAAVTGLAVEIGEDLSAQLTWSPVDSTIYGNPVTPDFYLVFYNEDDPYSEEDWYYLNAVPGTEFEHFRAAQFSDLINYRVEAWVDIAGRVEELVLGMSQSVARSVLRPSAVIRDSQ